jgi:hypothetical protein
MDENYGDRLARAMGLAGLKGRDARAKLATHLRVTVQAVGQVLTTPGRSFSAEISARAARFLKVDHYWLATGEGEPRPNVTVSEEAMDFARRYDKLDEEGRRKFSAAIVLARPGVSDEEVERSMPITAKRARQQENS